MHGSAGDSSQEVVNHGNLWFVLVAVMLAGYVVLDGFDLGAGVIYTLLVARTDEERRMVTRVHRPGVGRQRSVADRRRRHAVISPSRCSMPRASAASTCRSMMVLWLLMLRGIGIEFGMHIENPVWRAFFDVMFSFVEPPAERSSSARHWATWSAAFHSDRTILLRTALDELSGPAPTLASSTGTRC